MILTSPVSGSFAGGGSHTHRDWVKEVIREGAAGLVMWSGVLGPDRPLGAGWRC